jgi:hypothetical protein
LDHVEDGCVARGHMRHNDKAVRVRHRQLRQAFKAAGYDMDVDYDSEVGAHMGSRSFARAR